MGWQALVPPYRVLLKWGMILLLIGVGVYGWMRPSGTITRIKPLPYEVEVPKIVERIKEVPVVKTIYIKQPNAGEEKKIEKKIGGDLPEGDLLNVGEIKELCNGGYVVETLAPSPEGEAQHTELTIYPKPLPFFQWKLRDRELFAGAGLLGDVKARAEYRQGLLRLGPAEFQLRLGGDLVMLPDGQTTWNKYVIAGASVTF